MESAPTVVSRVAAILRALSQHEPDGATTTQIAEVADVPRPSAHRLLVKLAAEGLSDRDSDGRWKLGPEAYLLGAAAAERYDVTDVARPVVRGLADATGESAFFSARRGDETVCLLREDGSFPIRSFVLYEGIRFPLGVASAGLVILAYLDADDRRRYLENTDLTERYGQAHSRPEVERRVRRTRRDGYATNPGLIVPGSWGMAAAVFDGADQPRWALTLTGVESRFTRERRPRLGSLLLKEAHRLGKQLSQPGRRHG